MKEQSQTTGTDTGLQFPAAPILVEPCFSLRPWGGHRLREELGKKAPAGEAVGESWEVSDHPSGCSRIASGPFAGRDFGEIVRRFPSEMVGRETGPRRYPLLVKFIDAAKDLSIQVHPDDAYLKGSADGERGKTECWYVMSAEEGCEIIYGLKEGVTKEQLHAAAGKREFEDLVARHPLSPHTFLFLEPGIVHAILGGTMICEIQQSSDTTYRIWDWDRQPARPLHIEQALEIISTDPPQPVRLLDAPPSCGKPETLTDNEFFRVLAIDLPAGEQRRLPGDLLDSGQIIICVMGEVGIETADGAAMLSAGETAFLPAICRGEATLCAGKSPSRILLAESREL